MKKLVALLLLSTFPLNALADSNGLQNEDFKSESDLTGAGGTKSQLLNDSKIYVTAGSINDRLDNAINNGQIGGGGGGGKNYLSSYVASTSGGTANPGNGDFEANTTTGWSLAHSTLTSLVPTSVASAGTPFDSTHGGSAASGNLSLSIESTSPIQKKYSGKLISSAASTAGDMLISNAFYVDTVDQSAPLYISLSSSVTSGASNLNFSGTSSNSFAVYVYDVTAGAWIQPSGVYGMVSSGAFSPKGVYFQPASSTSTRYQLAIVNVNASAGAHTMLMDAFSVGPQSQVTAPAMSDWASCSPTVQNVTGTMTKAQCRRVGDTLEMTFTFTVSASPSASIQVTIPSGYVLDAPKASAVMGGFASASLTGGNYSGTLYYASTTTFYMVGPSNNFWAAGVPNTWANGYTFDVHAFLPIVGWSSNTVSSADTDTRVVAARANISTTSVSNAGNGTVVYTTKVYDSAGAYSTSTGLFTVPVTGKYKVSAMTSTNQVAHSANGYAYLNIYKNGSADHSITIKNWETTASVYGAIGGSTTIDAVAGDTLNINLTNASGATLTCNGSSTENWVAFERLSGPAVVQATETISASSTGSTTALTGSLATVVFTSKDFDDHNAMNAATGIFTCPAPGKYEASMNLTTSATLTTSQALYGAIMKNGSAVASDGVLGNGVGFNWSVKASKVISCLQGETISVQAKCDVNTSLSGTGAGIAGGGNNFSVIRVGN